MLKKHPLLFCCLVAACLFMAGLVVKNVLDTIQLNSRVAELEAAQKSPISQILPTEDLLGRLVPLSQSGTDSYEQSFRVLILLADDCPYSQAGIDAWKRMLEGMASRQRPLDLWVVSFGGTRLSEELIEHARNLELSARSFRPRDNLDLRLALGMDALPHTLLIDPDSFVVLGVLGQIGSREAALLCQVLDNPPPPGQGQYVRSHKLSGVTHVPLGPLGGQ